MKVGIQINKFNFPGGDARISEDVKAIAQSAEDVGFDSVWVMDHFFQIGHVGEYTDPMLEAYTTLSYLAGVTKKVTLGTMVTGVIYREPALLIKAVTTLDVLSGGRAILGIGAGWNDQEANALGFLDPLHSKRFERLEDTLQLALQMWSKNSKPFKGKIYNLEEPYLSPGSVQKPHPPILIGGGGEEKTLRFVAKYADACNLFAGGGSDQIIHKLDVLKKHCSEIGRDYDEIEKTILAGIDVTTASKDLDRTFKYAESLNNLGLQHIIYANSSDASVASFEKLAATVKKIHEL
jgi:F420-dependent oxidoreductase-like protein